MSDMRDDDWRTDDSLSEADIRRLMAEEEWEPVEVVAVRYRFTSVPAGAYIEPSSVPPTRVNVGPLAHSA